MSNTGRSEGLRGLRRKRSAFEWILLVVALAAIAAVVGGLVRYGFRAGDGPPDLKAEVRFQGPGSGGSVFEISVANGGGVTAEKVVIEVMLGDVTREAEIESVAKGDQETAFVVFPSADAGAQPEVHIVSYLES
jgi:uncharacterized protein (TIGR02588 family)